MKNFHLLPYLPPPQHHYVFPRETRRPYHHTRPYLPSPIPQVNPLLDQDSEGPTPQADLEKSGRNARLVGGSTHGWLEHVRQRRADSAPHSLQCNSYSYLNNPRECGATDLGFEGQAPRQ